MKPFSCLCNSVVMLFLVERDFATELIPDDRFLYVSEPKGYLARNTSNVSLCNLYVVLCICLPVQPLYSPLFWGAEQGGGGYFLLLS